MSAIGTDVKALRDQVVRQTPDEDDRVKESRDLIVGLRRSLVRVGQPSRVISVDEWNGAIVKGVKLGGNPANGKWIAIEFSPGTPNTPLEPEQLDESGNAEFFDDGRRVDARILRLELRDEENGPCIAVGGPVDVVDPDENGGIE